MYRAAIRPLAVLAGAVGVCLSDPALAFHPLLADDTGTQGMGGNQIEIGYDYSRGDDSAGRSVPLTYTRGLTDSLDVFVGTAHQSGPPSGWSNLGVGAKWRFYDNPASGLSLGLEPKFQFPVSARHEADGLGNGRACYGLAFLVTQNTAFGQWIANLAASRDNFADPSIAGRRTNYRLSVAPVVDLAHGWRVALDTGIQTNPDRDRSYYMGYVELGAVYSPSADLDLSAGLIRNVLDGAGGDTLLTTEVTWRF